jgi:hypothetical protein
MTPAALLEALGQFPVVAGTAAGVLMGLNALASVLRVLIEQRSRTRRFVLALENSDPRERPEIIAACGRLEASARPSRETEGTASAGPDSPCQHGGTGDA